MNLVSKKTCNHADCNKRPTFGVAGSRTVEFCSSHAKEGMVDVTNRKRCGHPGCNPRTA